jgi:hypothetical protein
MKHHETDTLEILGHGGLRSHLWPTFAPVNILCPRLSWGWLRRRRRWFILWRVSATESQTSWLRACNYYVPSSCGTEYSWDWWHGRFQASRTDPSKLSPRAWYVSHLRWAAHGIDVQSNAFVAMSLWCVFWLVGSFRFHMILYRIWSVEVQILHWAVSRLLSHCVGCGERLVCKITWYDGLLCSSNVSWIAHCECVHLSCPGTSSMKWWC